MALSTSTLARENRTYAGTGGVSRENRCRGFVPGFLDRETGSVYPSRSADGAPAPIHLLDGLPDNLVVRRTPSGHVAVIKDSIVSGFLKDGHFYTREQAAQAMFGARCTPRDAPCTALGSPAVDH
jgi:hypothetical protein